MSNPQAAPGHSLGLSVGATNLAAMADGQTALIRPSELTVHGMRLTGFVDRVGDPVPLIAPDGSRHQSEQLLTEALGAMAQSVTEGMPVSDVAITVPAHWSASVVGTLRRSLRDGLPVVSDATAALTALRANPALPTRGVILLCDFGGSGTSITLADAANDFAPIGETVRYADFSGDQIDQALLTHVMAGLVDASQADPSGTAMVGSLSRLRDECRRAKERLSAETATAVVADLAGHRADVRLTRGELENLVQPAMANFLAALDDTLERFRVPPAAVSAVATVGGGASIPLVTQRLSEHLRAPVVTTAHPQLTAAEGAALIAHRSGVVETATTMTPTPCSAVATTAMSAGQPSTSLGALAWSEVADPDEHLDQPADSRPELHFRQAEWQNSQPRPRRSPIILFGLSAAAALITTAVFGLTAFGSDATTPVEAAVTVTPSPAPAASAPVPPPPAPQAPQVTTVVVQRSNPAPQQPRPQQPAPPAPSQPPAPPPTTTAPPTTTPPTTTPPTTTPPTTTPPTTTPPTAPTSTPPSTPPTVPPIDPGPGDGGTAVDTPPIDPADGAGAPEAS